MNSLSLCACFTLAFVVFAFAADATRGSDKSAEEILQEAEKALLARKPQEAVTLASKAIELKKDYADAYRVRGRARQRLTQFDDAIADLTQAIKLEASAETHVMRGECYSALDRHADAIADFDRALALDPKLLVALHHRGRERFKNGEIEPSIADFDRMIVLAPAHENECWERGLSRYYARQFALAQKSFEDYHKVGPDDTENDLWGMLSQAEVDGLAKAQEVLATLRARRGGVFPSLYKLYTGKATPDEVLAHAGDGATNDAEKRSNTFYVHLYVGLWHSANRDRAAATTHMEKAVALRSTDYMWYVAREQLKRLKADAKP
jgi:lipoprotein NlpI